jgi:hypothetical protein
MSDSVFDAQADSAFDSRVYGAEIIDLEFREAA